MNITQMKDFPFSCKGIRTHKGHGGEPLRQASLYYQDKKIGFLSEGDWGGPAILDVEPEYQQTVKDFIKAQGIVTASIAKNETFQYQYDEDSFVDDALTFSETTKKVEALRKKSTVCFILPEDQKDTYRMLRIKNTAIEKVIEHVKNKYPAAMIL